MKTKWTVLSQRFNGMTQRERVMVASAIVIVLGMLCYQPLEALLIEHSKLTQQNRDISAANKISLQQIALYEQRLAQDPNVEYDKRLAVLKQQEAAIDERLSFQMVDMIPADEMPVVLSQLLENVTGIKLLQFDSIAPVPLLPIGDIKKINLYSHGIRLNLEGDYFSLLKFVQAVETMPNKLNWKLMDYKVEEYPNANVVIELYTLSINKDFISVANKA